MYFQDTEISFDYGDKWANGKSTENECLCESMKCRKFI